MSIFTTAALRLFGVCGVAGAILFMAGDLLYNHIPGSKDSPAVKMSRMPESRLLAAGMLGLAGCWFYSLASLHVYLALRPAGEIFAFLFALAFAAAMICYGITHTAYFAISAGAQVAARVGRDVEEGGKLGNKFFQRLVYITYIPVAISSLMMFYAILSGQSLYPRWMVIFLPVVIYVLKTPLTGILKGRIKEVINDSYDNFVLLVFFVLSTVVLWNAVVSRAF
jgi:uncharacterized membrane protein